VKRIAVLTLALLVVGAACGRTSTAPAATVDGTPISTSELVDELNAIAANNDYLNSLQTAGLTVRGTSPGSFDAAFVAQTLLQEINYSMVHSEFSQLGLDPSDACRTQARDELFLQIGNNDASAGETLFNKFPQNYQQTLERRNTELLALVNHLAGQDCGTPVDAASFYNAHPEDFTALCVSLIAVGDDATAASVVDRARAGEDFATLARQNSIDAQTAVNGGDIGCRLPSEFNPTVAAQLQAAAVGDVLDPIPGSGGISILKITDKKLQSLDESRSIAEELASSNLNRAFTSWLQQKRATAEVVVDKRYGTFDPAKFSIDPPALDAGASSSSVPADSSSSPP
jgi:hypothetical protein